MSRLITIFTRIAMLAMLGLVPFKTQAAEDVARGKTASPAAKVEVRYLVGRAESVHQSTNEDRGIRNGRSRRGRLAESDRFRSMLLRNAAHGGGGLIERGIP